MVAHDNPAQLHRLIEAVAPLPVFLHVDGSTPDELHAEMTDGLDRSRVRFLPRLRAGWARYEVLAAELTGYRVALAETDAEHLILLTGTDHPLVSTDTLIEVLGGHQDQSFGDIFPLPASHWGPLNGYDRFIVPQFPWRKHRLALPIPRRIPRGLVPAGGSQSKILCRRHAELVLRVLREHPRLRGFFRRCWTPDEVAIPSILMSPEFGGHWFDESVPGGPVFHIDWGNEPGRKPNKSPRWLDQTDLPVLADAAHRPGVPVLFARKFDDAAAEVVARIDAEQRGVSGARS